MQQIASGFGATLLIFFCTLLFSMPLGVIVALGRMSKFKPLSLVIQGIISILRGTPLMLQLIVVFYGPYYAFGIKLSTNWRLYATLIGFSINYAAYFAEIIFPQMIKRTIPPVTNEVITLVKDTSLSFVLAYQEMFTYAKQVSAAMSSLMPLFVAGVFYYIFNLVVTIVMDRIEKALSYYN